MQQVLKCLSLVVIFCVLVQSAIIHPPNPHCALFLQYLTGGLYSAGITDQTGAFYAAPISYRCGQNFLGKTDPYQICVECPATSTITFTATLQDTTTSTAITSGTLNCVPPGGLNSYLVCTQPTFVLPAFNSFTLTFKIGNKVEGVKAVISGDPHFIGFKGQDFDYQGEKGKIFQLFSDEYSSVNALLTDPTHSKHHLVTFMTSFGINYNGLTVVIKSLNSNSSSIIVNNVPVSLPRNTEVKISDCVYAYFQSDVHDTILIQSNYEVYGFRYFTNHFDFSVKLINDDLTKLGGLLGLTENENFDIANYKTIDLEENALLSTSSKYNSFKNTELECSVTNPVSTMSPTSVPTIHRTASAVHSKLVDEFTTGL